MQNLISEFVNYYNSNDEFQRKVNEYQRALNDGRLDFLKEILIRYKGLMLTEMLSYNHTKKKPLEKDVAQKTFYNLNELFDFLLTPNRWMVRRGALKNFIRKTTRKDSTSE